MYPLLRPLFFKLNPEQAHKLAITFYRILGNFPSLGSILRKMYFVPPDPITLFGLKFKNRIGLAAGYDKDGLAWRGLAELGFGHIEIGTVTPVPQTGNQKPRVFRLLRDRALINRLGFPGRGADYVSKNILGMKPNDIILGVNIGKNKTTPLQDAYKDYVYLLKKFSSTADYITINISSPNTEGLRQLQHKKLLGELLNQLMVKRLEITQANNRTLPLLVKLSPDLDDHTLYESLEVILDASIDGIIATNTTIARTNLSSKFQDQQGGLSGSPLRKLNTEMIRKIYKRSNGKIPIVAVGGIMSAEDANKKLDAGASLVQIFTGLIYRGPGLVKEILSN